MFPVCFVQYGAGVDNWEACAGVSVHSISITALLVSVTSTWIPCAVLIIKHLGA